MLKELGLNFIDIFHYFLCLYFILSAWYLWFIFFYYLWVLFVLLSIVALGENLGCVRFFLIPWSNIILLKTSLFDLLLFLPIGFGSLCFHFHLLLGSFYFPFLFHQWLIVCLVCMDVRVGLWRKLSTEELMLLNCGVGEDSWESLGLQGDPTSPFWRRSTLGFLWRE